MHIALVQGKCQFFKVLKVKKAQTSVFQVYLNTMFEYIWDAFEKQAQYPPAEQDRRLCHFLEETDSLLGLFSQSWNESFLFVLSEMLISKMSWQKGGIECSKRQSDVVYLWVCPCGCVRFVPWIKGNGVCFCWTQRKWLSSELNSVGCVCVKNRRQWAEVFFQLKVSFIFIWHTALK